MNFVFKLDSLVDCVLLVLGFLVALYILQWCLFSAAAVVYVVFAISTAIAFYIGLPALLITIVLRLFRSMARA